MDLLGYIFADPKHLDRAMTHRSASAEGRAGGVGVEADNERLEFLGDAVLELVVTEMLLKAHPQASEGQLSKTRATLVNERTLAHLARSLRLGSALKLGRGEENSGGRDKDSILASSLEAVVAAIYVDGGHVGASKWLNQLFAPVVAETLHRDIVTDYKTRLQEIIQAKYKTAPTYSTVESTGPDHAKFFVVELSVNGKVLSQGRGKSKKEAEQDAAKVLFDEFQ